MLCFFMGHRDTPESVEPRLAQAVERHIRQYGVKEFVVGGYGNFDAMAQRVVIEAKKRHPSVTLVRLLAYDPAERAVFLPEGCDGTFYPPELETTPKRFAIPQANRCMLSRSSHLIAYARYSVGNAWKFMERAQRRQREGLLHIENLAD